MAAALRSVRASAVPTALGLSFGGLAGVAVADPSRTHECLSSVFPDSDLNERYGVSERIIGPPAAPTTPGCRQAFAGEKWVRAVPPWSTAGSAETAVCPSDYDPDLPNPLDDSTAKFVGVHYRPGEDVHGR